MNSTIKKFIKLLRKEDDNLFSFLKKEYDALYESKQAGLYFEARSKLVNNLILTPEVLEIETDKQVDKVYSELKKTRGADIDRLDDLDFLATCYDKDGFFNRYDLLSSALEKYNFSKNEQAEVYAFYLNITIKHILNFLVNHKDRMLENVTEAVDNSNFFGKKLFRKKIIKDYYERDINKTKQEQGYVSNLRNIISIAGDLLPCENANDYLWVFDKIDLEIPKEVILLILTESEKRFIAQKEQKEAERQAIIKNEHAKEESAKKALQNASEREQANKERRAAVQELRKYLKDDKPICYIDDVEAVTNLLNQAGYFSNQINEIRRKILHFNKNHLELKRRQLFEKAKQRYLSVSEISLLNTVAAILEHPNAIKNPVYFEIENVYNDIKQRLITFIEVPDEEDLDLNYEAEYMVVCLTELNELIANYRNSNYKLVLEKNSN